MTCPNDYDFLSLVKFLTRFLWTHREVTLAPHSVVDLVLQVENAEKFRRHLAWKVRIFFFFLSLEADSLSQPERMMKTTRDLYN